MTKLKFFRQWIRFLLKARPVTDIIVVLMSLAVFFYYAPIEILGDQPATGGDTGSHYWPLVTLVKEALPNWQIRVWNPGNLGGEPHLTHYFPLPYLLMAFLSLFMPLATAFNVGTILPVAIFPLCVYACFRLWRIRFPIPALATVASLAFLYNESFSMWGGNALSTLAGQFAHLYAYCFFLIGLGAMGSAMADKRFPWLATFSFAAVLISHFYVALFLPVVYLCFLTFERTEGFTVRLKKLFLSGVGALLLSAWFVIPMLHNSKWNTAFGLKWSGSQLLQEAFPQLFWPFAVLVGLLLVVFGIRRLRFQNPEREWQVLFPLVISTFLIGIGYYFVFPPLGLVDIRVLPTLQLFLCLLSAVLLGLGMRRFLASPWRWFWVIPLATITIFWTNQQIKNFPYWMKWNYSSWSAKGAYQDLKKLSDQVRGDFSQGRIIYENSDLSNTVGSMRVFEMLPYFANRSTYESVYMQATVLAPAAFYLQALISKTPSCPFPNYQCTSYSVPRVQGYLSLMGISDLILISDEVRSQANQASFLKNEGDFGLWHLYHSDLPAQLVDVMKTSPVWVSEKDFKATFYTWFLNYQPQTPFQVVAEQEDQTRILAAVSNQECHPQVKVDFNQIELETDCVGKFHILKFAFHSTWKVSSGDELFLTSPGFIGLIPSTSKVTLTWGHHWLWTLSNAISWLAFAALLAVFSRQRFKSFQKKKSST